MANDVSGLGQNDPQVRRYLESILGPEDAVLAEIRERSAREGLPEIAVAQFDGRHLTAIALACGARTIVEIGTLGGYSGICLARGLAADGRLETFENEPRHAEVARESFRRAGLADRVRVHVGPALKELREIEPDAPFDLVFIDADKPSNTDYFAWALRLTRPGSVIIVDNVVRDGMVADAESTDASVIGTRRVLEAIAAEPRVDATVIQTVGVKGYDGFALALVIG